MAVQSVHGLPNRLTYPPALGVFVLLGFAGGGPWRRGVVAGVGVGLLFAVSTLQLGRRGFGPADAKLALSCAALLGVGWRAVVLRLVVAFFPSGLVSLTLLATRRVRWSTRLPVGPFRVLGVGAALVLGPLIMGSWRRGASHRPTTP